MVVSIPLDQDIKDRISLGSIARHPTVSIRLNHVICHYYPYRSISSQTLDNELPLGMCILIVTHSRVKICSVDICIS